MTDLASVGTFLSGVGSLGGFFGGSSDGIDVSENRRLLQMQHQETPRRIKATVAGYKQAGQQYGFHPLWLMGNAPGPNFSSVVGQSQQGSKWGDALSGVGRAVTGYAEQKQAQKDREFSRGESLSRSVANWAQASYYNSLAKRTEQKANIEQDLVKTAGKANVIPDTEVSRNPNYTSRSAAVPPIWQQQELAPGGPFIDWPSSSPMSADELTSPGTILMLMKNSGMFERWSSPKEVSEKTRHHFKRRGWKQKYRGYEKGGDDVAP